MTTAQVYQLVYKQLASNTSSTTISTDLKSYKVYVQSGEQADVTPGDIRKLTFPYTDRISGETTDIPLKDIAEFEEGESLNVINRSSQTRYISVTAGVDEDHNVTLVSNQIQKGLDKIKLPDGYEISMTGEDETIRDAMNQLYLMLILAVVFIYLIMVAQFQSFLSPFIIMFTIPLAFTGGFFALFVTDNEVGVVSMIGFVMLAGVIVNNGIVLVDYINQLRREGMDKKEAIVTAGRTRLRPILMTALTTILAMSTMAMGLGSGSEMMQPMAIVTEGGMLYGTLLTLIVVPCIYDLFTRNKSMVEEENLKKTVDKPRVPSYDKKQQKNKGCEERGVHIKLFAREGSSRLKRHPRERYVESSFRTGMLRKHSCMTGYKNRHCRYAQVFTTHPRYRMTGQIWNWLDMSTNKGGTAIIFALCIPYGIRRAFFNS